MPGTGCSATVEKTDWGVDMFMGRTGAAQYSEGSHA